ncbi:hypothetical protein [Thiofilum flexile]|uniref:hypothetical protein n=1 Tax=Thiofilum flexile TaxID=125627 RepID=UPI00036C9D3C|nr:hypothetical protein [Thiofilum flexile]
MLVRWMQGIKYLLMLVIGSLLMSCAPQYETRYELTPPKTAVGLQCLQPCEAKAQQCRSSCSARYDSCSAKAEQQAKLEMPQRMQEYELAMDVWRARYQRYLQDKMFYDMRRDQARSMRNMCMSTPQNPRACPRFDYPHWGRPSEPDDKPIAPTLASETKRIRKATCQLDCQCDTQYRSCYSSCGGGVKPQQICIRNCN